MILEPTEIYLTMKKYVHNIAFKALYYSGLAFIYRILFQRRRPTVLLFHELDQAGASMAVDALSTRYNIVSSDILVDCILAKSFFDLPDYPLILTFDDGRKSNLSINVFSKNDIPATNFISSSNERLDGKKFISASEITDLSNNFSIESHAHSHPRMDELDLSQQMNEINQNSAFIESVTGIRPLLFAYPYGKYNEDSVKAVKECGMKAAFTVDPGYVDIKDGPYKIKRICVSNRPTKEELIVKASGILTILKR
jgi:peptidoglycan/xylan/chitin deacetylase (PgdA/CDA1 family)